jgi:hypothetical protein
MGRLSLKAVVVGVAAGVAVAVAGLIVLVAAVAMGSGLDITDIKNADFARRPSQQASFLSVWFVALLTAGMTAGRLARGQAPWLHGGIVGAIALLAALTGVSRQDPLWTTALVLLSAIPLAVGGAHVGPPPAPPASGSRRRALPLTLAAFCVATVALAAAEEPGVVVWATFFATSALLTGAVHARFRGRLLQ